MIFVQRQETKIVLRNERRPELTSLADEVPHAFAPALTRLVCLVYYQNLLPALVLH
jgi:hypothetical protein